MIKIKGEYGETTPSVINFPDGTFKIDIDDVKPCEIVWKYENEAELVQLIYTARHIKSYGGKVGLYMPYIPNARMDRTKNSTEVFTLKYFCDIINWLGFDYVRVLDAHSSVSTALIDRVIHESPEKYIKKALELSGTDTENDYIFFPDEGSCKRYSSMFSEFRNIGFGIKKRDWATGKILGLDVHGDSPENRNVFIIDDICAYGGTVYYSALKLKELGCKDISVFFTHCENSITKGKLFENDLIRNIYTTNSLFSLKNENYPKINIIDCF